MLSVIPRDPLNLLIFLLAVLATILMLPSMFEMFVSAVF